MTGPSTHGAMAARGSAMDPSNACPYLGILEDPATHFAFPSTAQRCHATPKPSRIDLAKQARDCLTAQHVGCPRYHPPRLPPPQPRLLRVAGTARPVPVTARTGSTTLRIAYLLGAVAIALLVIGQLTGPLIDFPGTAGPGVSGPASSPTAGVSATPAASASPRLTDPPATPTPTAMGSPTLTPVPSFTPTPTPAPLVHVVASGETLTSIARQYGVSVSQLKLANRIRNPNLIYRGQRVVIPVR